MPFRRWFAERGADHPMAYSMLTLALGMVTCMGIAVAVSIQHGNRAIEQERASQRARSQESCAQIEIIDNAYQRQIDELTGPGKDIAGAWHYLATKCKQLRG